MKKYIVLSLIFLMTACAEMSNFTGSDSSAKGKMQGCLMSEANTRLQAGTLFTNTVTATAKDMVSTCVKKLALQSAGISQESQSVAENIINNLRNMSSAQ